jgi:hypothetical protein
MTVPETPELRAAREVAARLRARLQSGIGVDAVTQRAVLSDLSTVESALWATPGTDDAYAFGLATPWERIRRGPQTEQPIEVPPQPAPTGPRVAATESIASRAGALSDEIAFPAFVAGLLNSTFDAVVDASIRQIEEFASLVSAVAKDVDSFTRDNVTADQVRDTLAEQHPRELVLDIPADPSQGGPVLRARSTGTEGEPEIPGWLSDYGLAGEELTDELIEERLVPAARRVVGENRLQMLATMVLLGMNRVVVRDGRISARLRFRAAARDNASVAYAVGQDPGGSSWATRGSAAYDQHTTMVSTVGVNVQSDSDLRVELFGEVAINFASETLPLDRFVEPARMTILQRNARWAANGTAMGTATQPALGTAPLSPPPVAPAPTTPAPVAPAPTGPAPTSPAPITPAATAPAATPAVGNG